MQDNLIYKAPVSELSVEDRSQFIWKCYAHVVGAILAFAAIQAYFFQSGIAERIALPMLNNWMMAREEALARVRSLSAADADAIDEFKQKFEQACVNAAEWRSEHPIQVEKLGNDESGSDHYHQDNGEGDADLFPSG